jgi:type IV secretory pathway TraG/TraD family ATPase VirD4
MDWPTTLRMKALEWTSWNGLVIAAALLLLLLTVALLRSTRWRDTHKRGARVVKGRRAWGRFVGWTSAPTWDPVSLAGVVINPLDETKHFKLIGTTGTGKSTAIRELLRRALDRGDRAVITDPDGGYLLSFYHRYRGDVVLNPFAPEAVKWDPFAEVRDLYDVDQLAGGLIPSTEDPSGREWRGYARTFLTAVIRRCHERGWCDVAELWRLVAVAPSSELRPIVFDTPAQPFLEPENARMFGSIRSVAGSAAAALAYIKDQRAPLFSIRAWVQTGHGVLFIPYKAAQIAALRSIIATWMRLAIVETMSCPDGDQRLWFVVDELDALGAIDGLKDALARLRKFGGRCVLGFQSIAQVSSTYGAGEAQTIVENCGNTLILRCSGSEHGGTSHFASRLIGEREIIRRQTSRGRDREGFWNSRAARRSTNISEQHVTEAAVLPSELEQLPDLTGYLKTASCAQWLRVAFSR